jgi:hypothetical protein
MCHSRYVCACRGVSIQFDEKPANVIEARADATEKEEDAEQDKPAADPAASGDE